VEMIGFRLSLIPNIWHCISV